MHIVRQLCWKSKNAEKLSTKQDVDSFYEQIDRIIHQGKQVIIEDFFDRSIHQQAVYAIVNKYKIFVDSVLIEKAANKCTLKLNSRLTNDKDGGYKGIQKEYDTSYYMNDCGGYQSFRETNGNQMDQRLCEVFSLVQPHIGEQILDVGCGRGELSFAIAKSGAVVVGLDYSKAAIAIAQKTYEQVIPHNLQYICEDIFSYRTDLLDKIVMADIVEHIEQPMLENLIKKSASILKADGVLVVHTAPNKNYYDYVYPKRVQEGKQLGFFMPKNPRSYYEDSLHINEQTPDTLNKTLRSCFEHVHVWTGEIADIAIEKTSEQQNLDCSIFAVATHTQERFELLMHDMNSKPIREKIDVMIEAQTKTIEVRAGEMFSCKVKIINRGEQQLNSYQRYSINICYHLLDDCGEIIVFDGMRSKLSSVMAQGDEKIETLWGRAPESLEPGTYRVLMTLVAEECFWLNDLKETFSADVQLNVNK